MKGPEKLKQIMANNLKDLLKRSGKTQRDLAIDLNIPDMTISNWVNAKTYPRVDKIQLLADYFRVSRTDLTEEKPSNLIPANPQTIRVPILGSIACGEPILAEENIQGYRYESPDMLPSGEVFYLEAKGNSMEPTIPDGSHVLIRVQPDVENGQIAAVLLNGETEATLKRVRKQGDAIILLPDNNEHQPYIVNKDNPARIIGRAVKYTQDL